MRVKIKLFWQSLQLDMIICEKEAGQVECITWHGVGMVILTIPFDITNTVLNFLFQYAHKLAFLVGKSLHRDPAHELSDRLFFL